MNNITNCLVESSMHTINRLKKLNYDTYCIDEYGNFYTLIEAYHIKKVVKVVSKQELDERLKILSN